WKPGGMCPVSVPLYAPAISVA
ncbi:hypothetical protein AZ024_004691, partial [Escherichia coli]